MTVDPNAVADPTGAMTASPADGGGILQGNDAVLRNQNAHGDSFAGDMADAGVSETSKQANKARRRIIRNGQIVMQHTAEQEETAEAEAAQSEVVDEMNSATSPWERAWNKAGAKFLEGGLMFAAFGALLATVGALTGIMLDPSSTLQFGLSAAQAVAIPITGALWLGGNAFYKEYKKARADEDSRLNQTIGSLKERFGAEPARPHAKEHLTGRDQQQEVGEFGIISSSFNSIPGAVVFVESTTERSVQPENRPRNLDAILARGPRTFKEQLAQELDTSTLQRS